MAIENWFSDNPDCFYKIIEKLPLWEQIGTLRKVSYQWKNAVNKRCKAQQELTLLIGSGEHWNDICNYVKANMEIDALNYFNGMMYTHLTEKLINFFTTTFPVIKTLAVVVDDKTEDVNFLRYFPRLISAYSGTLTTLQVIFNVKNVTFQAIFYQLVASIDALHKLQRLSIYDHSCRLVVPPFDLPDLFTSSKLHTLEFDSFKSRNDIPLHWAASLKSRNNAMMIKINYNTMGTYQETSPHIYPVEVAAHFNFLNMFIRSSGELEYLTSAFVNLKSLLLEVSETLSVGEVITKLANLTNLTILGLAYSEQQDIAYSGYHLPVLSALSELNIMITDNASFVHSQFENLQFSVVFPKVKVVNLEFNSKCCTDCQWNFDLPFRLKSCATKLVTSFAKTTPTMQITFHGEFYLEKKPLINYFVDSYSKNGRAKLTRRYV